MTDTSKAGAPKLLSEIESYHAHIYYDGAAARDRAAILRQWIAERFLVRIGTWHESPVGPHPLPMFQVAFATELAAVFVPWPNTDRPRDDHLVHALWLGGILPLDVSVMPESLRDVGETNSPVIPNTSPRIGSGVEASNT